MNNCEICNKKLKDYRSKKCRTCWEKTTTFNINTKGKNNTNWKGNKVGYRALHYWIRRNKPKLKNCEICSKEKKLDVANISGKYKRDINDYLWLCRDCHNIKDGTINNLNHNKIKMEVYQI